MGFYWGSWGGEEHPVGVGSKSPAVSERSHRPDWVGLGWGTLWAGFFFFVFCFFVFCSSLRFSFTRLCSGLDDHRWLCSNDTKVPTWVLGRYLRFEGDIPFPLVVANTCGANWWYRVILVMPSVFFFLSGHGVLFLFLVYPLPKNFFRDFV